MAFYAYNTDAQSQTPCPVICPAIYSPVCATDRNGNSKTFPNDCNMRAIECNENKGYTITSRAAC